ncbi:hypothetical protein NEFER03_0360 [Nematocida sp. LUAm3]|nr:hypothetical protein NEFER03_0360 [Nematocida sp. LUAm3]KAI5176024.1 hypothetical protein NEFER02_1870 [Nematocida sp. LUAm2]KAI5179121.1 hypothetical protein NEFER01_1988 [Nematocida sp. LUAm1]
MFKKRGYQPNILISALLLFIGLSSFRAADNFLPPSEDINNLQTLHTMEYPHSIASSSRQNNEIPVRNGLEQNHKTILGKRPFSSNIYSEPASTHEPVFNNIYEDSFDPYTLHTPPLDFVSSFTDSRQQMDAPDFFPPYFLKNSENSSFSQQKIARTTSEDFTPYPAPSVSSQPTTSAQHSSFEPDRHVSCPFTEFPEMLIKKVFFLSSIDEGRLIESTQPKIYGIFESIIFYQTVTEEEIINIIQHHVHVIFYISKTKTHDIINIFEIIKRNSSPILNLILEWIDCTSLETLKNSSVLMYPKKYIKKFSFITYTKPFFMLINPFFDFTEEHIRYFRSLTYMAYNVYNSPWYKAIYILKDKILKSQRSIKYGFPSFFYNFLIHERIEEVGIFSRDKKHYIDFYLLLAPFLVINPNPTHLKKIILLQAHVSYSQIPNMPTIYYPKYVEVSYNYLPKIFVFLNSARKSEPIEELTIRNMRLKEFIFKKTKNPKTPIYTSSLYADSSLPSSASTSCQSTAFHYVYVKKLLFDVYRSGEAILNQLQNHSLVDASLNWLFTNRMTCSVLVLRANGRIWIKEKKTQSTRKKNDLIFLNIINSIDSAFIPDRIIIENMENNKKINIEIKKPFPSLHLQNSSNIPLYTSLQASIEIPE